MFHHIILHLVAFSNLLVFVNSFVASERSLKSGTQSYPPYTCFECFGKECINPYNKTCSGALKCFTHTSLIDKKILPEKGCLKEPFVMLAICQDGKAKLDKNETIDVTKCCVGNFCNDDKFMIPSILDHPKPHSEIRNDEQMQKTNSEGLSYSHISAACAIFSFLFVLLGTVSVFYIVKGAPGIKMQNFFEKFSRKPKDEHIVDGLESSGSGSGFRILSQRTIAHNMQLIECIGHGRFGEVWKGVMQYKDVAVKLFLSKDEDSWKHEVDIYSSILLRHDSILRFKCASLAFRNGITEMWLVTTFYERGSLYDYLLENTLTHKQMMKFLRSASSGLLHLHKDIRPFVGTKKSAIAHRDLKTRNILVSNEGTSVIADFGLAVRKGSPGEPFKRPNPSEPFNYQVGTKRYMAPEVLDESMEIHKFDSFLQADMYAMGLILWEVCSRCVIDGAAEDYHPPFYDCVPNNPDFEDMKKVVCIESKRPEVPEKWSSDETLYDMGRLMKECWRERPEARIRAYRLLNSLDRIRACMQ